MLAFAREYHGSTGMALLVSICLALGVGCTAPSDQSEVDFVMEQSGWESVATSALNADESNIRRVAALDRLVHLTKPYDHDQEALRGLLYTLIANDDDLIRERALMYLSCVGTKGSVPFLISLYKEENDPHVLRQIEVPLSTLIGDVNAGWHVDALENWWTREGRHLDPEYFEQRLGPRPKPWGEVKQTGS